MKKGLTIFSLYVVLAIIISLIWTVFDKNSSTDNTLSLSNFLNYISHVPTVNLQDMSLRIYFIEDKWASIIDWVRELLNLFGVVFGVIKYFCLVIYNIFITIVYFVKYVFNMGGITNTSTTNVGDGFGGGGSFGR